VISFAGREIHQGQVIEILGLVGTEMLAAVADAIADQDGGRILRLVDDLRPVLLDPEVQTRPAELYFMYRDVFLSGDGAKIHRHRLRYDVTVMRPGLLGAEYIKTAGHYHPAPEDGSPEYPEIYEVLYGEARYLLQRVSKGPGTAGKMIVEDFVVIEAGAGDKVVIPPGYGHNTVNPGKDPLVMSNWICGQFRSNYEPVVRTQGGGYYLACAISGYHFIRNPNYAQVPEPRIISAKSTPLRIYLPEQPLYTAGVEDLERLEWLRKPALFPKDLRLI